MYIADLHIHSKYSRATSKDSIPEYLDLWARRKGIDLIGTGDFTHPAWRKELEEKLIPAEEGFYILKEEYCQNSDTADDRKQTRFVVTGEISSIYKKNGKVRKVHNLILLPSLEMANLVSLKLEAIGNIHSDGRPILGLDSHDLLEILLDTCPTAELVPAHIWTPHFSVFGAFSGFDTLEECFEELTPYIHSLETGLSSDPAMNWRLSALDPYHLISNSDAHSPSKLGREATLIDAKFSYPGLLGAIRGGTADGLAGTIEFFPEEGKYHYDGHRNCNLCLEPKEAMKYGGRCPICGKKLTIGVSHRIEELADREVGASAAGAAPFESLVPLPEVIAASTLRSINSKKVDLDYRNMLRKLGNEFHILRNAPLEEIDHVAGKCVSEGIRRLRNGQVIRTPGFDGKYGTIQLLNQEDIDNLNGQISFFAEYASTKEPERKTARQSCIKTDGKCNKNPGKETADTESDEKEDKSLLNIEQWEAVQIKDGTAAIIAGPGTGKTKTLISRIVNLIKEHKIKPSQITAVTFTNKAAGELKNRLEKQLGKRSANKIMVGTFHSICLTLLTEWEKPVKIADRQTAVILAQQIIEERGIKIKPSVFLQEISRKKNGMEVREEITEDIYGEYSNKLRENGLADYDDILLNTLNEWKQREESGLTDKRFEYLLVDEFQDINDIQYKLIHCFSKNSRSLFVIGDPDQAIYGFRGSDPQCFLRLKNDVKKEFNSKSVKDLKEEQAMRVLTLTKNYRSTPEIIECALAVIEKGGKTRLLEPQVKSGCKVRLVKANSDLQEGIFIAKEINRMIGGIDMLDVHDDRFTTEDKGIRNFSDIGILYRTHRQAKLIESCLAKEGIPYMVSVGDDILEEEEIKKIICFLRFLADPWDKTLLKEYLTLVWKYPDVITNSILDCWKIETKWSLKDIEENRSNLNEVCPDQEFIDQILRYLPLVNKGKPNKVIEKWMEEYNLLQSKEFDQFIHISVFYKNVKEFIEVLLLGQEDLMRSSSMKYDADAVKLMTFHAAKGLEFPVVFLCGVNKGCIPLENKGQKNDIEEERRLFYVAVTRAEQELILVQSKEPSPFLSDLPLDMLKHELASGHKEKRIEKQLSIFDYL